MTDERNELMKGRYRNWMSGGDVTCKRCGGMISDTGKHDEWHDYLDPLVVKQKEQMHRFAFKELFAQFKDGELIKRHNPQFLSIIDAHQEEFYDIMSQNIDEYYGRYTGYTWRSVLEHTSYDTVKQWFDLLYQRWNLDNR